MSRKPRARGRTAARRVIAAGRSTAQHSQGTWTMTAYSMAEPRYPLRMSQEIYEVMHPPATKAGAAPDSVPALLSPGFIDWGPAGQPPCVTGEAEQRLLARPGFAEDER
jgi:hypothetical protein